MQFGFENVLMAVDAEERVDIGRAGGSQPAGFFERFGLFGFDAAFLVVEDACRFVRLRKLAAAAIAFCGSQPPERLQAEAEGAHGRGLTRLGEH
jgi:hypothetical protein